MTFGPVFARTFSGVFDWHEEVASAVIVNFFNQLYAGTRNDFTGKVGYSFTPTQNISIVALGRTVSTAMVYNHTVEVWQTSTAALVASAVITPLSSIDALGYRYEMLSPSVGLASGAEYRIVCTETSGGDLWRTNLDTPEYRSIAVIEKTAYALPGDGFPIYLGATANETYGPPTFFTT